MSVFEFERENHQVSSTTNIQLIFRTELVVKQVRASFHGQEFWSALNKVFGTALAATFRLTLHPIFLCPDHLDPSHFKFGKDEAIFDVFLYYFLNRNFSFLGQIWCGSGSRKIETKEEECNEKDEDVHTERKWIYFLILCQ